MDNLDEQVFAVVERYMEQQTALTNEGLKAALPSVDIVEIRASLKRLQDQGRILGVPLGTYVPYKK
jgi:hypothetical protein